MYQWLVSRLARRLLGFECQLCTAACFQMHASTSDESIRDCDPALNGPDVLVPAVAIHCVTCSRYTRHRMMQRRQHDAVNAAARQLQQFMEASHAYLAA